MTKFRFDIAALVLGLMSVASTLCLFTFFLGNPYFNNTSIVYLILKYVVYILPIVALISGIVGLNKLNLRKDYSKFGIIVGGLIISGILINILFLDGIRFSIM